MTGLLVEASSRTIDASARVSRRRAQRRNMFLLIAASYVVDAAVLFAYSLAGTTSITVPLAYLVVGLSATAFFLAMSQTAFADRSSDPYLIVPNIAVASAIQFSFLYVAPEVGFVFLVILFIVFGFGSLRLTARQASIGWGSAALGMALIMLLTNKVPDIPTQTYAERVVTLFLFVLALGRCMFLGLYGSSLRESLHQRNTELKKAVSKIEQLASIDGLTSTLNRRSLMAVLEKEIARARRTGAPLSVALLDLDWFKTINDRFGHLAGDDALRRFAELAGGMMRASDSLGRYGGEEFLLILPDATCAAALAVVERLRLTIAEQKWTSLSAEFGLTVSAGVSELRPEDSLDDLLARADSALYQAKQNGRNQAVAA
jgi:diguanylate cyclase (GGDEF)-like protein